MKLCQRCGERKARVKWCPVCRVVVFREAQTRYARKYHYNRKPRPPCQLCGKTLAPRRVKWCAGCHEQGRRAMKAAYQRKYQKRPDVIERCRRYQQERRAVLKKAWAEHRERAT